MRAQFCMDTVFSVLYMTIFSVFIFMLNVSHGMHLLTMWCTFGLHGYVVYFPGLHGYVVYFLAVWLVLDRRQCRACFVGLCEHIMLKDCLERIRIRIRIVWTPLINV